jgi:hypothetical protein
MGVRSRKPDAPFERNCFGQTPEHLAYIPVSTETRKTSFCRPGLAPIEHGSTTLRATRRQSGTIPGPRIDDTGFFAPGVGAFVHPAMRGLPSRANGAVPYAQNRDMNGAPASWLLAGPGDWPTIRVSRGYGLRRLLNRLASCRE